jgi:putative acetyltransferase
MKLRRSNVADVPRLLEIWRRAVDATHQFLSPQDRAEIDTIAEQYLPNAELILATDDAGEAMGFMAMGEDSIEALFVDPAVHGRGYGTLLVEHALLKSPTLRVEANEQAANAVAFYVAKGFRVVGRSPTDGDGRPYPLVHLAR